MRHRPQFLTRFLPLLPLTAAALAACADSPDAPASPLGPRAASFERGGTPGGDIGAVYTETNAVAQNQVLAFRRAADGTLSPIGAFDAGGRGIGGGVDPLTSQFAVVLTPAHDVLLAVNAGSDQVSSFRVRSDGSLTRTGVVSSGGSVPVSIAVREKTAYVLNAGDNTLQGFRVTSDAGLVTLPQTKTTLATGAAGGAAVRFTPDGRFLVVSERLSNRLEVFPVLSNGALGTPAITPSNGGAAFGFDVTAHGEVIVSETQGALTSYAIGATGALSTVTPSIGTGGKAACWVTITSDGRFAYTSNAGSDFVAGFSVDEAGRLQALTPGAATGDDGAGAGPLDLDHVGTRFLYTLEAGAGTIGRFDIEPDGTLTIRSHTPAGAPASGLQGLAAY